MTLEEATEKGLQKLGPGSIVCLVCGKDSPSYTNAKNHFEAIHFQTEGYNCEWCPKYMKTKHALDCHIWTGLQPTGPFEAGPVRQISGPAEIIK